MMRVNQCVGCVDFPCAGVRRENYLVPDVEVKPDGIAVVLISEAAPPDPRDYYYAEGGLFEQTTVQAFRDAGAEVSSVRDILKLGVYLTTAVKCGKAGGPSFFIEKSKRAMIAQDIAAALGASDG